MISNNLKTEKAVKRRGDGVNRLSILVPIKGLIGYKPHGDGLREGRALAWWWGALWVTQVMAERGAISRGGMAWSSWARCQGRAGGIRRARAEGFTGARPARALPARKEGRAPHKTTPKAVGMAILGGVQFGSHRCRVTR